MPILAPIQWLGREALQILRGAAELFALLYGAIAVLLYTRLHGLKLVLQVGVSQILFTGVHGLPLVGVAALAMGTLIIVKTNLPAINGAELAVQMITLDVIPLLVAFVLLGRSGTAICVELATKKLSGELDALRSMGLPFEHYVVLPRLVAGVVSAVVLTIYGLAIALGGGFYLSKGISNLPYSLDALVNVLAPSDVVEALAKACLFGAGIVIVSIREGVSVEASMREIPQATTRAVVRCMGLVVVLNSVISIYF